MKFWSTILFVITFKTTLGVLSPYKDSIKKKTITFYSNNHVSINSTHIPLNFFKKLYMGGVIEEKDMGMTEKLNRNNNSGFELDFSLGLKILSKEKLNGWYINFQNLSTGGAKYSQDLFNLIFIGNKNILNPINLNSTSFHFRKHEIFHIGLIQKNINFGMSFGNIINEFQGEFSEGDYMNFYSPYLWEFALQPNFLILENKPRSLIKNGNSIGFDFEYRSKNKTSENKKFNYTIGFNNLGLMIFHDYYEKYEIDTSFYYQGFSIDEVSNIDSTILNYSTIIEPNTVNTNEVQMSPFFAYGEINYQIQNFNFFSNLMYRHKSQYLPKLNIGIEKKTSNELVLGTSLSYGGYNKFQWGTNLIYSKNNINTIINIYNIIGLFPSIGKSLGLNIKIFWNLKK